MTGGAANFVNVFANQFVVTSSFSHITKKDQKHAQKLFLNFSLNLVNMIMIEYYYYLYAASYTLLLYVWTSYNDMILIVTRDDSNLL